MDYPLHLALAYLFLVGYFLRAVFVSVRLPGAVGVIFSGFILSHFMQDDILYGRDYLQGLAFFLVLLTAGFEISIPDLRPYILIFSCLPVTMELCGIALYAVHALGYTIVEGLILGTTLCCIGDGLVIPKMAEFGHQFQGHPMPRLVFTWAPLEASFALTLFGILEGMADPAQQTNSTSAPLLVFGNILRIAATLAAGAFIGGASAWIVNRRGDAPLIAGRALFNTSTVEAYLIVLAVALMGFGSAGSMGGTPLIPMGFCSGSLFQPELLVIVIGSFFSYVVDHGVHEDILLTMGGVWVFGQLVLFTMLGSKTDTSAFHMLLAVCPMMLVGLSLRLIGVFIATFGTVHCRACSCPSCVEANRASAFSDAIFCFLSTLPRATIQGALGPAPIRLRFFSNDPNRTHVEQFIAVSAKLYVVLMSVVGSILLDTLGPVALRASAAVHETRPRCENFRCNEERLAEEGWTEQERRRSRHTARLAAEDLDHEEVCIGPAESLRNSTGSISEELKEFVKTRARSSTAFTIADLAPRARGFTKHTTLHLFETPLALDIDAMPAENFELFSPKRTSGRSSWRVSDRAEDAIHCV